MFIYHKMISLVIKFALFVMIVLGTAHASVDCQYNKVIAIQAQSSNVLIRVSDGVNNIWKSLGLYSSQNFQTFQSLAQQALATDMRIILRFPDGYDCQSNDYSTQPSVVRIFK